MREDSKLVLAVHGLKPQIDKLVLIGELSNIAGPGEFIPVGRITAGLTQICLDVIMAAERVFKYAGCDIDRSLRCFESAYDSACDLEHKSPVICHGWTRLYDSVFVHAWCELRDTVYDYTIGREPIDKARYYLTKRIESEPVRYSFLEFCKLRIETGSFGPFDESFKN